MTDLNYIPSLTYVPPAHPRVVGFTESPGAIGFETMAMIDDEVKKAVAVERERCAKLAEKQGSGWLSKSDAPRACALIAEAIRNAD